MPSAETSARKRNAKEDTSANGTENGGSKKRGQPLKKGESKQASIGLKTRLLFGVILVTICAASAYYFISAANDSNPSDSVTKKSKRTTNGAGNISGDKYTKDALTNEDDSKIRLDLDFADALLLKGEVDSSLKKYERLLTRYPDSPRATFGKANALNSQAERDRSNDLLEKCIHYYQKVVNLEKAPGALVREAALLGAERMTFRGWQAPALKLMQSALKKFPSDTELVNKLGVAYLIMGHMQQARDHFKKVLKTKPDDGFAMVHLGFILKSNDNRYKDAIPLLREGLKLKEPAQEDGKFYFHLGDALYRTEQKEEAYNVYREGAKKGYFSSMWQRSLYNVKGLTARPWWTYEETRHKDDLKLLETNYVKIRDEALSLMNNVTHEFDQFQKEDEALTDTGDWRQFTLFARGKKLKKNCERAPITCSLIEQIVDAAWCKRGQVKFSVMQPGVHVWPHCGPTNCRIRSHLGLVVPPGPEIRVAEEKRTWTEGKFIIFDDSFEHEVWHRGDAYRLVLIVDFWHPELNENDKAALSPI